MHLFDPLEVDIIVHNYVNVYQKMFIEVIPLVFCLNTWGMIFILFIYLFELYNYKPRKCLFLNKS